MSLQSRAMFAGYTVGFVSAESDPALAGAGAGVDEPRRRPLDSFPRIPIPGEAAVIAEEEIPDSQVRRVGELNEGPSSVSSSSHEVPRDGTHEVPSSRPSLSIRPTRIVSMMLRVACGSPTERAEAYFTVTTMNGTLLFEGEAAEGTALLARVVVPVCEKYVRVLLEAGSKYRNATLELPSGDLLEYRFT